MFSIEHEFDATVITLVDEGPQPLLEDVTINSFAECVTLEQAGATGSAYRYGYEDHPVARAVARSGCRPWSARGGLPTARRTARQIL